MPYDPDFFRSLLAIAHGWRPRKGSLRRISKAKATEMAAEGVKGGRRALRASYRRAAKARSWG